MIDTKILQSDISKLFENVKIDTIFDKKTLTIRKINRSDFVGYIYRNKNKQINFDTIKEIIDFIKIVIQKNPSQKVPICLSLEGAQPVDKLTMSLIECICYHVLQNLNRKIVVTYNFIVDIITDQMNHAAFAQLGPKNYNPDQFLREFIRYSSHRQLRKIYQSDVDVSIVMSDFNSFGKMMGIGSAASKRLGKLVSEMVDNSKIHAKSSCLIDLDISKPYNKKGSDETFFGINLTVLNFSERYFYDGIQEKMNQFRNRYSDLKKAALFSYYKNIEDAYKFHKVHFDDEYTNEHFWTIASLQHHVSGRENQFYTNGVGLTELIKMIHNYSDKQQCYIVSGNIGIGFAKELMDYNNNVDKLVGFNTSSNFLTGLPDVKVLGNNRFCIPGTVYNLSFTVGETGQ